jgi:hypothetical protein
MIVTRRQTRKKNKRMRKGLLTEEIDSCTDRNICPVQSQISPYPEAVSIPYTLPHLLNRWHQKTTDIITHYGYQNVTKLKQQKNICID